MQIAFRYLENDLVCHSSIDGRRGQFLTPHPTIHSSVAVLEMAEQGLTIFICLIIVIALHATNYLCVLFDLGYTGFEQKSKFQQLGINQIQKLFRNS